jgi:integrase
MYYRDVLLLFFLAARLRLRVKDIDFDHLQIQVWNGKGLKHRLTTLAPELVPALNSLIGRVSVISRGFAKSQYIVYVYA